MNYDRIILELMDQVSALEDEVSVLKSAGYRIEDDDNTEIMQNTNAAGRDTTKYILDGRRYGKNRLVLAVVKKYMEQHQSTSAAQLMLAFDKSLQGSLGVVRTLEEAVENCSDYKTRFFVRPEEIIHTSTEDCTVCTQWGIANIGNIVARAKELGIDISVVK